MKMITLGCAILFMTSCGYESKQNDLTGQVKKVVHETPLLCDEFDAVSISLGVIRNGVGSMSTEDINMYVANKTDVELLKQAAELGQLVKITYDDRRFAWCVPSHWVTHVLIVK
jgi:hypothetical protein